MLYHFVLLAFITRSLAVLLRQKKNLSEMEFRQKQFNIQDLQYYSLVTVGKQTLHAVMDTGSIDLIVISDRCSYQCGATSRLFHPTKSDTYKFGFNHQVISYGSGDLKGREAYDNFAIGPLKATTQGFWEITDARMPLLRHSDFEVIVGLGPFEPDTPIMTPDGDNELAYAGMLDQLKITRYGFCLMSEFGAPGYLIWNDQSLAKHPHLFSELRTIDEDYWMAKLSDVKLGDKTIACHQNCAAILDSGTSLLALPEQHYSILQHAIWKLGPKCEDLSSLPNLYFKLDGVEMFLPPDAYLGEVEGFVEKTMERHFKKSRREKTSCQEALMHVDMDSAHGSTWVFGMPFFRSYYAIFQQGSPTRMFVATADNECKPTSSKKMDMYPSRTRTTARHINAEKLRFSPGIQKVISLGYTKRKVQNAKNATNATKKN